MKKYGVCVFDRDGFAVNWFKVILKPEQAKRIFEKYQKNNRGLIVCLDGPDFEVEYTSWALGSKPGVHDVEITETEILSREELFDLFPDLGSWTQRIIARQNECGGVCY